MKTSKKNSPVLFFSFTWEFLNEYLTRQAGHSAATVESYRDSLSLFRRYLNEGRQESIGKFKFSDCNKDCVYGFREYLKQKGNKPSTINVRVTAIRSYLNYASDKDISIQSVALSISQIKPYKKIQKEREVLSEGALSAVLSLPPQTKPGLRDRTIMIMLYDSAGRVSELLSVRLNDINLDSENPAFFIHGKGNKERWIQLTESSVGHLKQYLQVFHANSAPDAYLFSTTIKGITDKMSRGNVLRIIKHYANIARETSPDMPASVYSHMFRRTRATNLYQDGVDLELVSALLGHAQLDTTKIYAKPSVKQLRDAMESVPTPASEEEPLWVGNEDEMARLCGLR
jgi:site-specific recombinase XerD